MQRIDTHVTRELSSMFEEQKHSIIHLWKIKSLNVQNNLIWLSEPNPSFLCTATVCLRATMLNDITNTPANENLHCSIKMRTVLMIRFVHSILTINYEAEPMLVSLHAHTLSTHLDVLLLWELEKWYFIFMGQQWWDSLHRCLLFCVKHWDEICYFYFLYTSQTLVNLT